MHNKKLKITEQIYSIYNIVHITKLSDIADIKVAASLIHR